jgi:hypothetical protein
MKKDIIHLIVLWSVILLLAVYALARNDKQTEFFLRANAHGIEDYTSEIDHLQFGGKLREAQLDMDIVYNRANAIACAEGFYKSGSVAQRNNNPGNLKAGGLTDTQGHTIYTSELSGWLNLYRLLYKHRDKTIEQIGTFYASDRNWSRNVRVCASRT